MMLIDQLTGIDTNVLLRYLTRDDEPQHAAAERLLLSLTESAPGFITQVTLVEVYWTLARSFRYSKGESLAVIRGLLESRTLEFEDGEGAMLALHFAEEGADFADALIHQAAQQFGASTTVTFDRKAAETLGWTLLES
ncbi:MAG: PIN domain-containing protein [Microbacteriaceae bacterium]